VNYEDFRTACLHRINISRAASSTLEQSTKTVFCTLSFLLTSNPGSIHIFSVVYWVRRIAADLGIPPNLWSVTYVKCMNVVFSHRNKFLPPLSVKYLQYLQHCTKQYFKFVLFILPRSFSFYPVLQCCADKMNERPRSSAESSFESVKLDDLKLDDLEEKGLQCIANGSSRTDEVSRCCLQLRRYICRSRRTDEEGSYYL
jgi:hypothetical protein